MFNKNTDNIFRQDEKVTEINISPLIDLVFILLIFFIVTTTFTRETGVTVTKPKAQTASKISGKILKIAITREGTIHVHDKQVSLNVLEEILKREKNSNPDVKVIIIADDYSVTGNVVKVIDKCNLTGIKNVSLAAIKNN